MTEDIKRVVVSLDAASETGTAIDTAARLAARWRVPLHGVFIEDEELIGLAGLPFARQVTLGTGLEPLTRDHVEDHFHAFAERVRRELAAAADRHGVKWSFEIGRNLLAAGGLDGEDDFVVAGAVTRPIGGHFRISSRCWSWTATITRPFLLAKREWDSGGSVFILLRRRGPQSVRTLAIAAQFAAFRSGSLTVAGQPDPDGSDNFAAWVSGLLAGHSLNVRTEPVAPDPAALRQRIIDLDCRLLVIEASEHDSKPQDLRELAEHLACDLLIIR
jgi:hypothetical protein